MVRVSVGFEPMLTRPCHVPVMPVRELEIDLVFAGQTGSYAGEQDFSGNAAHDNGWCRDGLIQHAAVGRSHIAGGEWRSTGIAIGSRQPEPGAIKVRCLPAWPVVRTAIAR